MSFSVNPMLTLEQRRALLWIRSKQPTVISVFDPGAPGGKTREFLLTEGLIALDPQRKRHDPLVYSLTDKGEAALKP
jgi:hypothetical protein